MKTDIIHVLHIKDLSEDHLELTTAMLGHLEVEAIEERDDSLVLYHHDLERVDQIENQLLEMAPWVTKAQIERSNRPNENWNKSWESSFSPIVIDDFCTIRATFHDIDIDTDHVITIDPEMAFGTGHHETTHAMIQMMQRIDLSGKTVMDYGTGTAILAILAEQRGASVVFAFDYDEVAIECAQRCVELNDCTSIMCATAEMADTDPNIKYEVILANINRNVLLETAAEVFERQKPEGSLLLSGILKQDRELVIEKYKSVGYELKDEIQRGEWMCLHMIGKS